MHSLSVGFALKKKKTDLTNQKKKCKPKKRNAEKHKPTKNQHRNNEILMVYNPMCVCCNSIKTHWKEGIDFFDTLHTDTYICLKFYENTSSHNLSLAKKPGESEYRPPV